MQHDIFETIKRYDEGIDASEETLAFESIEKAGPDGNYLTDDLTMKYLKTREHYLLEFCEVYYPGWDRIIMMEKIHKRAEENIENHKPEVNWDRIDAVKDYVNRKVKEIIG